MRENGESSLNLQVLSSPFKVDLDEAVIQEAAARAPSEVANRVQFMIDDRRPKLEVSSAVDGGFRANHPSSIRTLSFVDVIRFDLATADRIALCTSWEGT